MLGQRFEKVEMQFLSDLYLTCPECNGSRYTSAALEFRYEGKTISEILQFTVSEAIEFFAPGAAKTVTRAATRDAARKTKILNSLRPLQDLGLGYLRLGQPLNTLSGGEAQRLKLCTILIESTNNRKPSTNNESTLLILDEPTTGLHFGDIEKLLAVFQRLVDSGHSLVVIEHNLDVMKSADYLLDIGPGPGAEGGHIVASGTPEEVAKTKTETARFLAPLLGRNYQSPSTAAPRAAEALTGAPAAGNVITISGAREHNLKNIDLEIPRDAFVVVTGLSGSGKSTLAFDIIFAEGQRRFLDSMSPYARQFAEQMEKPDIDRISGLPPTVAIEQRISRGGGKSTVATVTEIYHFLRLLFAKLGIQHCLNPAPRWSPKPRRRSPPRSGNTSPTAGPPSRPLIRGRKGFHTEVADWARRQGYARLLVDQQWKEVEGFERLERFKEHDIDVEVARFKSAGRSIQPLRDAIHNALRIGKGTLRLLDHRNKLHVFSKARVSPVTGRSFEELDPSHFSFNSPRRLVHDCLGYGEISVAKRRRHDSKGNTPYNSITEAEIDYDRKLDKAEDDELTTCPDCDGSRLNDVARSVYLPGNTSKARQGCSCFHPLHHEPPGDRAATLVDASGSRAATPPSPATSSPKSPSAFASSPKSASATSNWNRSAKTSLAAKPNASASPLNSGQTSAGFSMSSMNPPSASTPATTKSSSTPLCALQNKGNSLLVVEHDDDTMRRADHIIDLGPAAGRFGGEVVASRQTHQHPETEGLRHRQALKHPLAHPVRGKRRPLPKTSTTNGWLKLKAAMPTTSGMSTSPSPSAASRSSPASPVAENPPSCAAALRRSQSLRQTRHRRTENMEVGLRLQTDQIHLRGRSVSHRQNFPLLPGHLRSSSSTRSRKLFAQLPDARLRGFDASRFSFNNETGRCPECRGNGRIKLEMDFLPSTWTHCEACNGKRYNPATLEVRYNHKSIGEVLAMTSMKPPPSSNPTPASAGLSNSSPTPASATSNSARLHPRSPGARHNASNWSPNLPRAARSNNRSTHPRRPRKISTSSRNLRSASTSRTSKNSSMSSIASSMKDTPWWSSNTTPASWPKPTISSTSARKQAAEGAGSSLKEPRTGRQSKTSRTAPFLREVLG